MCNANMDSVLYSFFKNLNQNMKDFLIFELETHKLSHLQRYRYG